MDAGSGDWLEIVVEVAGIDSETVADIFRQACEGGAAIQPSSRLDTTTDTYVLDGDGPALVKGYIRPGPDAQRLQESLRLAVMSAPLVREANWQETNVLAEESWRDAWKKHFGLQRIGESLVIRPSWVEYRSRDGDVVVEIDPGMAFGTGQHPTTAMCLRLLEESVSHGSTVLDLGSGSGILAIAAAKLGATRVLAIDTDPQAVSATRENVAANNVSHCIEVREGSLEPDTHGPFGIVVANISGLALERLAAAIRASLNDGGSLIASGFLDESVTGVKRAFEMAGLIVERTVEEGVWRSIVARRPDA